MVGVVYSFPLPLSSSTSPVPADHRHYSRHIHRPLSKLPTEGRRKKSSKKGKKDKNRKGSRAPSSGPIEEGEDEEEEEEEESIEAHSAPSESEKPRDVEVTTIIKVYDQILYLQTDFHHKY